MPLEIKHNTFFWKYPINYREADRNMTSLGVALPDIADNDYNTFADLNSIMIDVRNSGFTHIFLKTLYVDSMAITFNSGTLIPSFDFPNTILNSSNRYVRIDSDGFQNILFRVNDDGSRRTASNLNIVFTPISGQTTCQIFEVMVLDEALVMSADRRFTQIQYKLSDRASILQKDIAERITKIPGINSDRWKWDVEYKTTFRGDELNPFQQDGTLIPGSELQIDNLDGMLYNRLIGFIKDRTTDNFCFCGEYPRYPERVHPATFPNPEMLMAFLSDFKASGEEISFTVIEL